MLFTSPSNIIFRLSGGVCPGNCLILGPESSYIRVINLTIKPKDFLTPSIEPKQRAHSQLKLNHLFTQHIQMQKKLGIMVKFLIVVPDMHVLYYFKDYLQIYMRIQESEFRIQTPVFSCFVVPAPGMGVGLDVDLIQLEGHGLAEKVKKEEVRWTQKD